MLADSLEGDLKWPSDQQVSNGDNPSLRSFSVRSGGVFGTRCPPGMSRNSWRSAVWMLTIPPCGAGSCVMLLNWTNGCDAISNRPTSRGESTRLTVKVKGIWRYLYRAIDSAGATIDFLLSARRDADAAKRLFR